MKPTIVLVHGAFAESASWNRVVQRLHADGPLAAHRFMAEPADARANVELPGASHAIAASEPTAVAEIIRKAATSSGWEG
nr:hypothetical protein OHB51_25045 [Micromonospora sp. NBC_00855]